MGMNTSVWVRSIISKQYSVDKFFKHVSVTLGKEFGVKVNFNTEGEYFKFTMLGYSVEIHREEVENLQRSGLYSLDRHILDKLEKLGLQFNVNRSQYIKCCYGIYNDDEYNIESSQEITIRFSQIFNINIEEGSLFYPCCGIDTYEPLALFINTIKEFHFADGGKISLPLLECGVCKGEEERNRSYYGGYGSFSSNVIPFATYFSNNNNYDTIKALEESLMTNFKFINIEDFNLKEVWKTKFQNNKKVEIFCHKFEGALSLINIDKISVFYYRVDSKSLSSLSFNWFSPIAFNSVLERLVEGGLIITDGIKPKEFKEKNEEVEWSCFWDNSDVNEFVYNNRIFNYIGECGERYGKMKVWRVEKL